MAKFAFIVPPLTGHVNPTLSIGSVLLQKGHEVAWITLDRSLQKSLPEGGKLLCIEYNEDDGKKQENEKYLDIISKKIVYGIESIKFLYEEVLIPLNLHMLEGIDSILDSFQPDVVIHDHQLFAGAIAAYKRRVPYVTSVTAPAAIKVIEELPKIHAWEISKIIAVQQTCGIEGEKSIACSETMTLVFTSKEFFGDMALADQYHFVGPVIRHRPEVIPFDWDKITDTDNNFKILISIGTTFDHEHKRDFFQKAIEAFKDEPITVIVVSEPSLFEEWPENFIVQSRVPQLSLLPHLDMVVCHAGHNTVCETLSQGLPLVVIPIAYDQQHVASRVFHIGAGLKLNYKRFKPEHLRQSVVEVLQNPKYRETAKKIQQSFENAGGTEKAVSLLEKLLKASAKEVAWSNVLQRN